MGMDCVSSTTSSLRFAVLIIPFIVTVERDPILLVVFILFEKLFSINVIIYFMNSLTVKYEKQILIIMLLTFIVHSFIDHTYG
jgi:hypothetical protein